MSKGIDFMARIWLNAQARQEEGIEVWVYELEPTDKKSLSRHVHDHLAECYSFQQWYSLHSGMKPIRNLQVLIKGTLETNHSYSIEYGDEYDQTIDFEDVQFMDLPADYFSEEPKNSMTERLK